ncbi:unnamed protein product [Schistocephalus solidus]|uniref:Ricin B-type lectin domain-containing protein n=1 Tax=Schistocephalus solidus TaxID=70667 RepID=A0A183TMS9_SCHSO|nr:unnamed protein product [Schistocephalus solidus]
MHRLPPMQVSRSAGAAVALPDGRVCVAGGRNTRCPSADGEHASVEFCNLPSDWQTASASEFWHQAAPMMKPRSSFAMAYFKVRVIATGGGPKGQRAELFSPPDADHPFGQWTLTTFFSNLNSCTSLVICNDRLFAVGGE